MKHRRGVVLLISAVFMAVLLVLISIYFSGLMTEKKSSDVEKFVLQTLSLSEAGANHGLAELRDIIDDLVSNINTGNIRNTNNFSADSLTFLDNYSIFTPTGIINFTRTAQQVDPTSNINGDYVVTITVVPSQAREVQGNPDTFRYFYNYQIESQGRITNVAPNITRTTSLYGSFTVTAIRANFARYALFTSHHMTPSGTTVWFTANTDFTGPVHTNERFSFANNPSGHFTGDVTQHMNTARFYNNGSPIFLNADRNGTRDVPIFDTSFERGVDLINLPSSVSQNDLKTQALGTMNQPGQNGIYIPNSSGCLTGGIYVRGDASVTMSVDASNRPAYTITRGTNTKLITVDYTNNQTIVANVSGSGGTAAGTYCGVPNGVDDEGTIIYTQGAINSLSGTVQQDTAITVSSEQDLVITNNVTYQSDPRIAGNESYANVLGILAWGGDVRIGTAAPNNINIHGVVMAPHGEFTVDNYDSGSPRGIATLLGGAITDFYGPFGQFSGESMIHGYGRNFVYDARMSQGTNPPYFPYMDFFTSSSNGLNQKPVWQDEGV